MMSILRALALPLVLAAATPAASGDAPAEFGPNVSITLTVGRAGGTPGYGEKVFKLLGQQGEMSRMLMGWRTPLPTRSSEGADSDATAMSYVYQNIGISADLKTRAIDADRFLVSGQIEISGVREDSTVAASDAKPPTIATFQQVLSVVLTRGKKLRVAEGPDPDGGTLYLDLRVDRLE